MGDELLCSQHPHHAEKGGPRGKRFHAELDQIARVETTHDEPGPWFVDGM